MFIFINLLYSTLLKYNIYIYILCTYVYIICILSILMKKQGDKNKKQQHEHADVTRIRISPGRWTRSVKNLGMGTDSYPFFSTSFDSDFL